MDRRREISISSCINSAKRLTQPTINRQLSQVARAIGPMLLVFILSSVAHAQGTMDFSGAQTLMGTFNARFAYVATSRGSRDAHLYTDDSASPYRILSKEVAKTSAVEPANICNRLTVSDVTKRLECDKVCLPQNQPLQDVRSGRSVAAARSASWPALAGEPSCQNAAPSWAIPLPIPQLLQES
jgi:hypothetical protein